MTSFRGVQYILVYKQQYKWWSEFIKVKALWQKGSNFLKGLGTFQAAPAQIRIFDFPRDEELLRVKR